MRLNMSTLKMSVVCLSVCYSNILRTVHLTNLTLGRFVAEDPGKCSVQFGHIEYLYILNKQWTLLYAAVGEITFGPWLCSLKLGSLSGDLMGKQT